MKNLSEISHTYGELLPPSVSRLLSMISLDKSDHFVDLGSGLGKLALQFFSQSCVLQVTGIELLSALHDIAQGALSKLIVDRPELFAQGRRMQFLQGSFFDIPFDTATVVLIGSPCFGPTMLYRLGQLIEQTTSIHTLISLRPIPQLQRLVFKKAVRLEGSWDTTLCYLYQAKIKKATDKPEYLNHLA